MLILLAAAVIAPSGVVSAAQGVMQRIVPAVASSFRFSQIPAADGKDTFEVEAHGGKVYVSGSSAVAMCRGAYEYLKDACHAMVSWSGDNVANVKSPLPAYAKHRIVCPNDFRHYFNVCTFGYTTVWWDWKRWQHEIDWMALHGINMPLAMNGQEAVWQRVFRSYGLPDNVIRAYFGGPAFLPWQRMGNVDGHMGPLPQSWIDGQAGLQKKILARERELGMTPVVPGFSGFVPPSFGRYVSGVKLDSSTAWAGFSPTTFIDIRDPHFIEVGRKFVQEYRKEFGSDHLYLCDTFNEQNPQFPDKTKLRDLAQAGKAVYEALRQGDPSAVWVMQGWLFYNAAGYWQEPEVSALLSSVPKSKMIILDLASNEHEVWRDHPSMLDKGYIYNTLHNYGQTTNLYGDLQNWVDKAIKTRNDKGHGRMLGMGLTPEGIDQNPVLYELMTDAMWTTNPIDVPTWLATSYVPARYGSDSAINAWGDLLRQLYTGGAKDSYSWRYRPGGASPNALKIPNLMFDAEQLLKSAKSNPNDSAAQRDLVDVTKTWLGALAEVQLTAAQYSYPQDNGSRQNYERYKTNFFGLLQDLDRLLATRPEHRLSTWIADARKWGGTPAEKDLMERNARMQITVWGGPYLADYANKEWAGLIDSFFVPRWKLYFANLETGGAKDPDYAKWENQWAQSIGGIVESKPGNPIKVVEDLIAKHRNDPISLEAMLDLNANRGIALGKPVIDSGHTEPGGDPSFVTDGNIFGGYWAASPAPQWVQIDLLGPQTIDTVDLFPYCADRRYYQYRVDISIDGKDWKQVVDESNNIKLASIRGYHDRFEPVLARYVRVTMLKNSANVGVHLHEVRIDGPKKG